MFDTFLSLQCYYSILFYYMFLLFVLRGYVRCNHIIACFCGNMLLAPTQQIRCMTSKIICHFVVCFQHSLLASKSGASLGCGRCACCRRQRLICRGRAIKDWMEKNFGSQFADLLRLNALNHGIWYVLVDFLHMYAHYVLRTKCDVIAFWVSDRVTSIQGFSMMIANNVRENAGDILSSNSRLIFRFLACYLQCKHCRILNCSVHHWIDMRAIFWNEMFAKPMPHACVSWRNMGLFKNIWWCVHHSTSLVRTLHIFPVFHAFNHTVSGLPEEHSCVAFLFAHARACCYIPLPFPCGKWKTVLGILSTKALYQPAAFIFDSWLLDCQRMTT